MNTPRAGLLALAVVAGIAACRSATERSPPEELNLALPGAAARELALGRRLQQAWTGRQPGHRPRTKHLRADGSPRYTNRLLLSANPYLLQHAHNPVDWYPWGEEAFAAARRLGRPVLLSVGYSTCHWCHVMEEESFDNEEVARVLNQGYIAIKVDREERPDVDSLYMKAVQLLTGSGGWPMTVWLTPDRRPFYAGSYFPPRDGQRGARHGLLTLLGTLRRAYDAQRDGVVERGEKLTRAIRELAAGGAVDDNLPRAADLARGAAAYGERFDTEHGGLSGPMKFPSDLPVRFLLRQHCRTGEPRWLEMARLTLEQMWNGGLHDHLGGGFHRYSTDGAWRVPHFEKMLYDNALLVLGYLEGYQVTGTPLFAEAVRETLRYVEREMTSPEGAFYSATDADSSGPTATMEEGRFFTWTPAEIDGVLGAGRGGAFASCYGATPAGQLDGRSVLHVPRPLERCGVSVAELAAGREVLRQARALRPPPFRDEKILAAWNGLMISAFARAAVVLDEERYARAADRAASFVLGKMRRGDRLLRSFAAGRAEHLAYLEDYTYLAAALIDLFEATGDPRWLREAMALDRTLARRFEDARGGGFYATSDDHEALLAREKPWSDHATPSGNSVHALSLLRLQALTGDERYGARADRLLRGATGLLARSPTAAGELLLAADFRLGPVKEIVLVAPRERREVGPFTEVLRRRYLPNRVLIVVVAGQDLADQQRLVPLLEGKVALGGKATAYVCEGGRCRFPTTDAAVFAEQLKTGSARGWEGRGAAPRPGPGSMRTRPVDDAAGRSAGSRHRDVVAGPG